MVSSALLGRFVTSEHRHHNDISVLEMTRKLYQDSSLHHGQNVGSLQTRKATKRAKRVFIFDSMKANQTVRHRLEVNSQ